MPNSINALVQAGPDIYYDDTFRRVLEDHMTYLRNLSTTTKIDVEPIDVIRYQADFYGLLTKLGIQLHMQWIILRMTGLTSPSKIPEDLEFVLVPDESEISRLKQSVTATTKIVN
jgi:hypothetical protein